LSKTDREREEEGGRDTVKETESEAVMDSEETGAYRQQP
jgi:hypothetical protein